MHNYANSQDGALWGSLGFLEQTRKLIAIMIDNCHVVSLTDSRLQALGEVSEEFFCPVKGSKREENTQQQKPTMLMSNE